MPSAASLSPDLPSPVSAGRPAGIETSTAAGQTGFVKGIADGRLAAVLQIAASIMWIPQAGALSFAVGGIAYGRAAAAVLEPAIIVLALGIVKAGLDAAGGRLAFRAARKMLSERRDRAVAALSACSPLDVSRPPSGLAASTLAEQAEAIVPYLSRFQPARLRATIVPLVILSCVLVFSWAAALVLLVAAPLIPIFMALIGWRAKAASGRQLGEVGGMNAFLLDRLRGLATIRSLDAVDATASRVRANAESLRSRTMAVLRIAFLSSAVLELFAALGVAMVAVYVGFHLLGQLDFGTWGSRLSLSEGLFILLLAPAFFEPLRDLSGAWHDRAAGEAAVEALERLSRGSADLLGANDDQPIATPQILQTPAIRIDGLRYQHAGTTAAVFDGFDLAIAPGEHVALLAPSGAGKSTLLALIAGLAVADAGRIAIGDQALGESNAAALRQRIAWIGQAPHIFAGTFATNVSLGRPGVTAALVAQALDVMQLQHVRHRGSAAIGEGGIGLSGGEALRLALARIAVDPEATLILADEPTAHLDSGTAQEITDALLLLARGRTLIVATHDPVLAARMDRVIHLAPSAMETAA
jgi:ATP-binding cassette subfamily C protein CydD